MGAPLHDPQDPIHQGWSSLFDFLPIGAYRSRPDGTIVRLNQALLAINGYDSEAACFAEARTIGAESYVDPSRRQQFWELIQAQGWVRNFVSETVRLKTGERIWVREHAHLVRDAQGTPLYIEGTVEDITSERQALDSLRTSENLLRNVLETIPDRVWVKDPSGRHMACNKAFADLLGCTVEGVVGKDDLHWFTPEVAAIFRATDQQVMHSGQTLVVEGPMPPPNGSDETLYEVVKTPMRDEQGAIVGILGMARNIHQRKLVEAQLLSTQSELQATFGALPDLVFEYSPEGHYRAIHHHDARDLWLPVQEQLNRRIEDILPTDAAAVCMAAIAEALRTGRSSGRQYSLDLPRGRQWFELSVVPKPTPDGEERRLIAIARNITERKHTELAIEHLAFHDPLTGLPNRRLLGDRLENALAASQRHQEHGALLFIDLDRFKALNDQFGHDVGDLLLQEVARRLLQCVRGNDTVARLGGDEFVVLIQNLSGDAAQAHQDAAAVGQKVLESLNHPYVLRNVEHAISPSVGATLFKGLGMAGANLLRQADQAMYEAKAAGRNRLRFHSDPSAPVK